MLSFAIVSDTSTDPLIHSKPFIHDNYVLLLGTVVNHGNTEITETVIFVKCRESRGGVILPECRVFAVFFCQNAVVLPFLQEYFVFNQHKLKFIVWI